MQKAQDRVKPILSFVYLLPCSSPGAVSTLHPNEILAGPILQLSLAGELEAMSLIEADGSRVLLQRPERMCAHVFHRIFQQLGTQALSLQDWLHEELFDLSAAHEDKAFYNAIVSDPDILQRIGIPLCYVGNLQLPKIEFVIEEDGIK